VDLLFWGFSISIYFLLYCVCWGFLKVYEYCLKAGKENTQVLYKTWYGMVYGSGVCDYRIISTSLLYSNNEGPVTSSPHPNAKDTALHRFPPLSTSGETPKDWEPALSHTLSPEASWASLCPRLVSSTVRWPQMLTQGQKIARCSRKPYSLACGLTVTPRSNPVQWAKEKTSAEVSPLIHLLSRLYLVLQKIPLYFFLKVYMTTDVSKQAFVLCRKGRDFIPSVC
jgi:hypothetical protein